MMNIVYLIDGFGRGGRERQLLYLIENISKQHKISIFIFSNSLCYDLSLPSENVHIYDLNKAKTISNLLNVMKKLKEIKPDIIHYFDNISSIYAIAASLLFRTKIIDGSIRYAGKLQRSKKEIILKKISLFFSRRIIANSYAGLRVENLQNDPKASVIYNGIEIQRSKPIKQTSDNINIVMVASFTEPKDYFTFIKVAIKMIKRYDNLKFHCIGDGPLRRFCENMINDESKEKIIFYGKVNDVFKLLSKMSIGVLLSNTNGHAEGISNSIMEYMCAGLPVIATNAGGTPEIVEDKVSGFLVPAFEDNMVCEKITFLINNPEFSEKMGKKGRKIIEEKFSIKRMTSDYIRIYTDLLTE